MMPKLTPRQREVFELVLKGMSQKEIAAALGITAKTANSHATAIRQRFALADDERLTTYALRELHERCRSMEASPMKTTKLLIWRNDCDCAFEHADTVPDVAAVEYADGVLRFRRRGEDAETETVEGVAQWKVEVVEW